MQCFFHHTVGGDTAGAPHHTHTHMHAHGQTHITPLLLCIHPSCMCTTESEQQRKNSGLSLFLYLSLLHPLHSLSVVLKHVLLTERVSSASPTRNALNPTVFFFPLSLYPSPPFRPFHRTGHAFLINHFHSFIYLFILWSLSPPSCRFQALISCNLLAWHRNESEREGGRDGERERA